MLTASAACILRRPAAQIAPDAKELVDDPLLKPKPGFEKTLSVFA
jgi:hypothetical protein